MNDLSSPSGPSLTRLVPVSVRTPHPADQARGNAVGLCRECAELAHGWGEPQEEMITLAGETFTIVRFHCRCECRCPAVLTTTVLNEPAPPAHSDPTEGRRA